MRAWWEALGPLRRPSPCPPQPSLCPTPGTQSRGSGEHRTLQPGGTWTRGHSRCSGELVRAPGPGGPSPMGEGRLESVEGHPRGPLRREAAQSHRREGGRPGRLLARPGRAKSRSPPALELLRATVCAVRAITGQTTPSPMPAGGLKGQVGRHQAEEGAPLPHERW